MERWRSQSRPLVGLTADLFERNGRDTHAVTQAYTLAIEKAGGTPLVLPSGERASDHARLVDALVLSGGDDPILEPFGDETHPDVTRVDPRRQSHEVELLERAMSRDIPILGVCLGMQYMGLLRGGHLDQRLVDTLGEDTHWETRHAITGSLGEGEVLSRHRQAMRDAGDLEVCATAPDGVIEAIRDPAMRFCVGVQWHPERTDDDTLGFGLFRQLVEAR